MGGSPECSNCYRAQLFMSLGRLRCSLCVSVSLSLSFPTERPLLLPCLPSGPAFCCFSRRELETEKRVRSRERCRCDRESLVNWGAVSQLGATLGWYSVVDHCGKGGELEDIAAAVN